MSELEKGIGINHGYIQVRIQCNGQVHYKNFGKDSPLGRKMALIYLCEKRKDALMGKAGIGPTVQAKPFDEVADLFLAIWSKETNPEGQPKHTEDSIYETGRFIEKSFKPALGRKPFDSIRHLDIQNWRDGRLKHILGTSANREQATLSSLFSHIETWVKSGKIEAFKLPAANPCEHVEKAKTRKRERVLSTTELSVIKAACTQAKDADLWEICKMALKSLLRKKDLMRLEAGFEIDMNQAKTGVRINLPVQVLRPLNYKNFRKRWEGVRKAAGVEDVQFRDLRKTGANLLKLANVSNKLISEFLGHTNTRTTEVYMVKDAEHLRPLADKLTTIVDAL